MHKKIKLVILILLTSSVYFIYNFTNKSNITYITLGDSISLGENSYGAISYSYSDYFKDYLEKNDKLAFYDKSYTSKNKTITELYNDLLIEETMTINNPNHNIRRMLSDADIVSLSIGLNDIILEVNRENYITEYKENRIVEEIANKYKKLINEIRKYYKNTLYVIGYYENGTKYDNILKKLNEKYKNICQKNNDIFIDTTILSKNEKYFNNPNSYYPNANGYKEISKIMINEYEHNLLMQNK